MSHVFQLDREDHQTLVTVLLAEERRLEQAVKQAAKPASKDGLTEAVVASEKVLTWLSMVKRALGRIG